MKSLNGKSQILGSYCLLILSEIKGMTTQSKNECTELECKILQIKELAKELDEEN